MSEDHRQRFESMVQDLERNPRVKLIQVDYHKPATASLISRVKKKVNGELPPGMEEFYRSMDGFQLKWKLQTPGSNQGEPEARGLIDILPLDEVFGDWKESLWSEEGGEEYKPVKPVDFFAEEACAALMQPEGEPPRDEIVYHYLGESLERTGYTFAEWLDRLLAARGYFYWVRTLCAGSESSPEVQTFRRTMPRLFADYDDVLFQPKTV